MNDEQFYVLDSLGLVVLRGGLDAATVSYINEKLDACVSEGVVAKISRDRAG